MKRTYASLLIAAPLLLFLWGCQVGGGAIRLDTGSDTTIASSITDVAKVAGTRATVQFAVSEDILYTTAALKCMDTIYGTTWNDNAAVACSSAVDLTPGETETVTLTGLLPDKSYLVKAFVPTSQAMSVKSSSTETALSPSFEISTALSVVFSDSWLVSFGFVCDTGDANGDGNTDILCGGTTGDDIGTGAQVGMMLGTGSIPSSGFSVVKFSSDPVNGSSPGWCSLLEDINGDGHDDVVISDFRWDDPITAGDESNGALYFFYGPLAVSAGDTLSLPNDANQVITDSMAGVEFLGQSCAYYPDLNVLLVGWPGYTWASGSCNGGENCGGIMGYQWSSSLSQMVEAFDGPILKDYTVADAKLGERMNVGDYNGDGVVDLHYLFTKNGTYGTRCHDTKVILGGSTTPPGTALHTSTYCLPDQGAFLMGTSYLDVNQDGYDDFVVYELVVSPADYKVTIYYGGATVDPTRSEVLEGSDEWLVGVAAADVDYNGTMEVVLTGTFETSIYDILSERIGDELGVLAMRDRFNAVIMDLNGDGYPEFINVGTDYAYSAYFAISY